ncbi:hypothetical protein [Thalassococcus sp. S3]|uniref:hypothetical protein n=1 Tax=Thalassococcus sp. S3 TaxID=2017482 RepID=UPI00102423F4|nr:hypothetical protein [Thalassococcus sp. S3]QBF32913.1 hypothetical protein CFI11_17050 [Thalassococcus sp. S3]
MRPILILLALGALAACAPTVPDSGAGVGFDNSVDAQRARDAELTTGAALPPATAVSQETLAPAGGAPAASAAPATATAPSGGSGDAILDAAASLEATNANSGVPPLQASPSNPPPGQNNAAISDENDFDAVSSRQTIESDAQRIAQNRAQYQVVPPTALPSRAGNEQPNVVQYALDTSHPRGTRVYSRAGINMAARAERNCAAYASADQAQIDFLSKGGPQRDRMGLDPDGDGYACGWDPAPFRAAVRN